MALRKSLALLVSVLLGASSCRSYDLTLELLVKRYTASIPKTLSIPPHSYFDDALYDPRVKQIVKKNLSALLSNDWKSTIYYCSFNDIDFSPVAVEVLKNKDSKFYEKKELVAFIESCLSCNSTFLQNETARNEVFKVLQDYFTHPIVSLEEVFRLERVFDDYPVEKETVLKHAVTALISSNSRNSQVKAKDMAVKIPSFLSKPQYEFLAAVNLKPEVIDEGFVRCPQFNDALQSVEICKKINPCLNGVPSSLLEKILNTFDNSYTGFSLSWICDFYQKLGFSKEEALRRSVLFCSKNLKESGFIDKILSHPDFFKTPPSSKDKEKFLQEYAASGIKNLAQVFHLSTYFINEERKRQFFNASFHRFMSINSLESCNDAIYLCINQPKFYNQTDTETVGDLLISTKYVTYDGEDTLHDFLAVPSMYDIERAVSCFKRADEKLSNITSERFTKILYVLSQNFDTYEKLIKTCAWLGIPRTQNISDQIIRQFTSGKGGSLLSSLLAYGFSPSETVAKAYCDTVLDKANSSIYEVFLFIDSFSKDPFTSKQYITYGTKTLSKNNLTSSAVRNAALAFEHGITIKNADSPSSVEFSTTLDSIVENLSLDVDDVISLHDSLNKNFWNESYTNRLNALKGKTVFYAFPEFIKLCRHMIERNNDEALAMLGRISSLIHSSSDTELSTCAQFMKNSIYSNETLRLAGDLLIENGRVSAGAVYWKLCNYTAGIASLEKRGFKNFRGSSSNISERR